MRSTVQFGIKIRQNFHEFQGQEAIDSCRGGKPREGGKNSKKKRPSLKKKRPEFPDEEERVSRGGGQLLEEEARVSRRGGQSFKRSRPKFEEEEARVSRS